MKSIKKFRNVQKNKESCTFIIRELGNVYITFVIVVVCT